MWLNICQKLKDETFQQTGLADALGQPAAKLGSIFIALDKEVREIIIKFLCDFENSFLSSARGMIFVYLFEQVRAGRR